MSRPLCRGRRIQHEGQAISQELDIDAALEACAREPIHVPGAIQPFGVLVVLDADLQEVIQVSSNIGDRFNLEPEAALGKSASALLGEATLMRLRARLDDSDPSGEAVRIERTASETPAEQGRILLSARRADDCVVVEIEPLAPEQTDHESLARVNRMLEAIDDAQTRDTVLERIVACVRELTGHDRVMAYAFDRDWHGTVLAEDRAEQAASYLGLWFPASDIPPQARAMYADNPLRLIPDVDARPAALVPQCNPRTGEPLNLGKGLLRAVSPIHLQYLRNMGVAASLSIRIRHDGELWGLVACHHHTPLAVSPEAREAALAVVAGGCGRMFTLMARAEQTFRRRVRELRQAMTDMARQEDDIHAICTRHSPQLLSLFTACGIALIQDDKITRLGSLPGKRATRKLGECLAQTDPPKPWHITDVADMPVRLEPAHASGLLAIPLDLRIGQEWLLIFRPQQESVVSWAGNPAKSVTRDEDGLRLSPRSSFDAWRDASRGKAEPWTDLDLEAAREIAHELSIIASSSDIRALNERLQEEQQALARANTELERLAQTDSMTGIWNRYRMEQAIDQELQRAQRYNDVFSLILLDIDEFKQVNDRHGHAAGDHVLQSLAQVIAGAIRDSDHFARWGGEEFVVLAPQTDPGGVLELAERLRTAVEAAAMPDQVGRITVSLGVATWQPGATLDSLLKQADRGLYLAKEAGRNCARSAPDT